MNEIKNFDKIKIRLASPEQILSWSYGEVKKPETINYRRLRPEVDGLFCERIFGTTKDWECFCGKFKSQRYKGVICERCGVEVTSSKVRRERMGHIKLVAPVSHIWYYRSNPSRIPLILGISKSDLRSVLYYEKYIVVNPQETGLKECQIMTEDEYNEANEIYGGAFTAGMGAEPIRELLSKINLDQKSKELREEMHRLEKESKGDTIKRTNILKRIEIVENFRISGNRPEWMILTILPIIPPDLRPMIQLEGGRFATSDLNDLYRRVINRNNRLQRLIDMRAPETVLRNEKRMLQEAVDSLLDNSAQRRMVKGANNRPLKSLADALKGKQGRFRQNLLGKRVDYSGRSVIVVGPELKLYQCGLPSLMALELFKPFIMKRLLEENYASNVRRAKMMVEEETPEVWALLDSVVKEHPVLLNRAPTLHRLSVQAFEPVLVDGKAIKLHPLVCKGFNADFDGDQMAVHVPLTVPAQIECWTLMLSATNMLDPASGKPVMYPSQDMVLGIHYLTSLKKGSKGEGKYFDDLAEIFMAVGARSVDYNAEIVYKIPSTGQKIKTTVGRVIFNSFLPEGIPFQNETFGDKSLQSLVAWSLKNNPRSLTMRLLDSVKDCGFKYATIFGATLSPSDMLIPKTKNAIIDEANKKELEIISQFTQGAISKEEKYTRVLDLWRKTSDSLTEDLMKELEESQGGFNPLWLMAHSGARGSKSNFTQLGAMRGLMQKPNGETIELPVKSSFKEGLSLIEFYISTNGARKGLADTALKTSKAGHLTRRLVDVAQDIVISEEDCGTINGVYRTAVKDGDKIVQSLASRIAGRFSLERIVNPLNNEIIVDINQEITDEIAKSIEDVGVEGIICRSVLTCESKKGVCQKCYGRNLANNKICNIGDPVGIIAAQSIGQPGTQLTMRTFHEGGTASTKSENNEITFDNNTYIEKIRGSIVTKEDGTKLFVGKGYIYIKSITEAFDDIKPTVNEGQTIVNGMVIGKKGGEDVKASSNGFAFILNGKLYLTKATESVEIRAGSQLLVSENSILNIGDALVRFDPHTEPILTEVSGKVSYVDIDPQTTLEEEIVEESEEVLKRISESTFMGLDPRIQILDNKGKLLATYNLPGGAELEVDDGQMVEKGSILVKLNRSSSFDSDITQGLPKIEELVEARIVNNPAVLAKVDGKVEFEGIERKNYRVVNVISDFGQKYKHLIPLSKHLLVRDGDHVETAERLCDGPINPYEMLEIAGESELYKFLINEIQQVYRSQNIEINDKHLAIILKQMLKKVKIVKVGDTNFVQNQLVDKHAFQVENERVASQGGESAIAKPLLQGISKTSLSNSFIAAASFQETTKILTNAAIAGSTDELTGLKENVIIGHAIPAGTGMKVYNSIEIIAPQNDDLDKKLEELKTEAERINSFKEEDWSLDEEYLSQDEADEDDSYEDGGDN